MTYRGIVSNGVVVMEGETPAEGTLVEVTPVAQLKQSPQQFKSLAELSAFGMWRDRTDLPGDSADAAQMLREQAEKRG